MAVDMSMQILIVDDYKTMLRIVRNLLKQLGFNNVDEATDGSTALQKLRERQFRPRDLRLEHGADDRLAASQGSARGHAAQGRCPSSWSRPRARPRTSSPRRQAGVNNYIVKPFNAATLKQKIASVIGDF